VASITCFVYQESEDLLVAGSPWPCSTRKGIIEGIPVGEKRKIVCMGINKQGNLSHLGQIDRVTIFAGQIVAAGVMDFYRFITMLTTPADGARVTANQFSLNWDSVPNAYQYLVQVAADQNFESLIVDELTPLTTYSPMVLLPQTTYYWRVYAVDFYGHQGAASQQREFTTLSGILCRAPDINPIGNQSVGEGEQLVFTVSAIDPDPDDELIFSSSPLPTNATFDTESGIFQWTTQVGDEGYYAMIFTVCDSCPDAPLCDVEDMTISVGGICQPPVLEEIGPRQVYEQELLHFTINATDPDSGPYLTYRAGNLPSGADFTPADRTFSWTPAVNSTGNYQVLFEVCDDCQQGALCDTEQVSITVGEICRPPELRAIGARQIDVGETLEFRLFANDPDSDSILTYSASGEFNQFIDAQTGLFLWTPADSDEGVTYAVRFNVCDDCFNDPLCDSEDITITVGHGCRSPVLETISPREVNVGQTLSIRLFANDPDAGTTLTYGADDSFGDFVDPQRGIFEWTPTANDAGETYIAHFWVCDNCPDGALCDTQDVVINVLESCGSPQFDSIRNQEVAVAHEMSFTVNATDPDPESQLTYQATRLPDEARFTPANRTFFWIPEQEDVGTHQVEFSVCDDCPSGQLCDSATMTITVINPPCQSPTLEFIGNRSTTVGQILIFDINGTDPDADSRLTYAAENLPEGAAFQGRTFSWTPSLEDEGSHEIRFIVCDDCPAGSLCDNEDITITVNLPYLTSPALSSPQVNAVLDNGCDYGDNGLEWNFSWSQVPSAAYYQIQILNGNDMFRRLSEIIESNTWRYSCNSEDQESCNIEDSLDDFSWRVRAGYGDKADSIWGEWSEIRSFQVEPLNTDCPASYDVTIEQLNPPSGSQETLEMGIPVNIDFSYTISGRQPVYIFPRPFTDGELSPISSVIESPVYSPGEGSGTNEFTISAEENVSVDQIRFIISSSDNNQELEVISFDVSYDFVVEASEDGEDSEEIFGIKDNKFFHHPIQPIYGRMLNR
jgi:hypothetical protein